MDYQKKQNQNAIWDTAKNLRGLRAPKFKCSTCNCNDHMGCTHAGYKCYIFVGSDELNEGWSRDRIITEISANGIPCYSGSCSEVYLEKHLIIEFRPKKRLPNASELSETSLMFLIHQNLTAKEIKMTCNIISKTMHMASNQDKT